MPRVGRLTDGNYLTGPLFSSLAGGDRPDILVGSLVDGDPTALWSIP